MSYTYVEATGHGFVANDPIVFSNLDGGQGIVAGQVYYVIATGLTADVFQFSETVGGAAFAFDMAITSGDVSTWPTYTPESGIMSPPTTPATPTNLAWSSAVALDADGHQVIRIDITLDAAADAKTRFSRVSLTGPAGNAIHVDLAPDQTSASVLGAIGNVSYSAVAVAYDVYGNASAATAPVVHTTVKDTTAPAVPTGLVAANGILGIGLAWTSNTEADFDHYDVLVDDDVAFGSAASFVCRASLLSVVPLTAGTYYVKIRAVDTSGNASAYCTAQSAAARLTGTSDLDPTAIINQATNVLNGPATIKVDSTGLTIENGALILKDEFGTTVMVASGFAGTWSDFFATGLYNGLLLSGTVGTVTNGRSSKLPYWTAADTAGTPTLSFLSGGGVKTTFAAFGTGKSIVSDVVKRTQDEDIEFGVTYDIGRTTAGSLRLTVAVENNSAADFSGFSSAGTHDSNVLTTAVSDSGKLRIATSPVGGPYFRLRITMEEITAHNAANYITVNKAWMLGRGQSGGQLTLTDSLIAPGLQVIDGTSPTVQLTHGLLVTSGLGDDIAQDGVVSSFVPIGCVLPFAGAAAPTGWLLCQGQSVLRATYPNLFSAIGTTFGAADGTHFTLPDMRNRFPIGAGTSAALAATGGSFSHTHTSTAHSHSHSHTEAAHTHPLSDAGQAKITIASSATLDAVATPTWTSTRRYTNTLTSVGNTTWTEGPGLAGATDSTSPGATGTDATSTTPGATGSNNPPYIGLNFIIKAE